MYAIATVGGAMSRWNCLAIINADDSSLVSSFNHDDMHMTCEDYTTLVLSLSVPARA